ncbi:MAG: EF-hand domain-containing protein, partial [Parvibaculaceae bacterium]
MQLKWLRIAPVMASFMLASAGASGAADDRLQALRDAFSLAHGESFKIDRMASYVAQVFQQIDVNGDGLEQQEIERATQKVNALRRAQIISQYLRYDLDGNFEITTEEVVSAALDRGLTASQTGEGTNRTKRRYEEALKKIMRDDQNGDGVITLDELKAVKIDTERRDRSLSQISIAQALLVFDQTGDGRVTQIEAFAAISQAFANDDIESAQVAAPPGCKVSGVDPESAVVLIGVYEGESVSTVSVAGQDKETSTAAIRVEEGSQKLTLFLTSYDAMVWRIEGATDRVAQVVLTSQYVNPADRMTAAGVVGIGREKVSFVAGR